jgi:hypothetical protein
MKLLVVTTAAAALLAALAAPLAKADPARHMHDYLATTSAAQISAVPPDIRDHAEIRQLVASPENESSTPGRRSSFSWGDAGIGAAISAAALLAGAGTLRIRRRASLAL